MLFCLISLHYVNGINKVMMKSDDSADKTSKKRNFEFQPLRRAGEMTHHEWGDYFVHEHVRPCDVELCQFLTTKCDCRMI